MKLYVVEMWSTNDQEWINLEFWIGPLQECLMEYTYDEFRTRRVTSREEAEALSKTICNTYGPYGNEWDLDTYEWEWPAVSEETE
jgi:hypothetical protein